MLRRQSFVVSGPLAKGVTVSSVETTTKNGVSKYLRIELRQTKPQPSTLAAVIWKHIYNS